MHVPESAHKEDNIDPRPVVRRVPWKGKKVYLTVEPKMSITVRDTVSDMMDGRE